MALRYSDVLDFQEKFDLPRPDYPRLLERERLTFRQVAMYEEISEFGQACKVGNLTAATDALVDLVYFALGTASQMGLPFNDAWDIVHAANMRKVRADNAENSRRGDPLDVVKPEGWVSPEADIAALLEELRPTGPQP